MRKKILFSTALSTLLIAGACGNETENEGASDEDQPLQVYTTLFAWESLASEIGGEYVEVENIVPPGSDAHSYEPTLRADNDRYLRF
ncbi:metal ABC transporter solute-binding protein, Zn/Mn family [Sinobaca sp. H24]|uniref:metal ABC transporter substrate-binding protein n=1 Tax=Sinobaca sp. H24 TaxID=2923376 RepID=UPI00207A7C14|nr:zinc ABC transporter substrate-binding protein [Sinobaca sp. H24]